MFIVNVKKLFLSSTVFQTQPIINFMALKSIEEIYDDEIKAANGNVSSKTIAINAMVELKRQILKEVKPPDPVMCNTCEGRHFR